MTRKILVFSPKIQGTTIVKTEANTWEELSRELKEQELFSDNMTVFLKESNINLKQHPKKELPIGEGVDEFGNPNGIDCSIILSISKTEAGAESPASALLNYLKENTDNKESFVSVEGHKAFYVERRRLIDTIKKVNPTLSNAKIMRAFKQAEAMLKDVQLELLKDIANERN